MKISELVDCVREHHHTKTLSVAVPHDGITLKAARDACDENMANVLLFGNENTISEVAEKEEISLDGFQVQNIPDEDEAVYAAVKAAGEGDAQMLMKGNTATSTIMRAVLHSGTGIVPEGNLLSHVGVFYAPTFERMMLVTDAGINISPNLSRKIEIIKNAVAVAHRLGVEQPRVALLAAIEKLNISKMPITVEAELLEKMGRAGMLGKALVEGPFALDNAISPEAARLKHLKGKVAGRADILVVPDIEAGNILYKAITSFAGLSFASVVVGSAVPIVMPSRVDSEETKLASIALASYLSD